MSSCVLDSSALLAILCDEPDAEVVAGQCIDALLSVVNLAEVYSKTENAGISTDEIDWAVDQLQIVVVLSGRDHAQQTVSLREQTRKSGLSLGDRAYLALGVLRGMAVIFIYAMGRVDCPDCGVKTEYLEWSSGKERMTTAYKWFLSTWARRLSWSETARIFGTSWNQVYRSVHHAVLWWLVHREKPQFTSIGIDEIASRRGHRYLKLVYQIDVGMRRLLWAGEHREERTLHRFFDLFLGSIDGLQFVCSGMWKPHLNVIAERAPRALNILDRYHVMASMYNCCW